MPHVPYTRQELDNIRAMNAFLNPPRAAGTPDYAYTAIKQERAQMWSNFVKKSK